MNDANVTIEIDSSSFDKQWPNHDARDRDGRCEDEVGTQDDPGEEGEKAFGSASAVVFVPVPVPG